MLGRQGNGSKRRLTNIFVIIIINCFFCFSPKADSLASKIHALSTLPQHGAVTFFGEVVPKKSQQKSSLIFPPSVERAMSESKVVKIPASTLIRSKAGTISFWVRPHGGHSRSTSHTFLSLGWNHPLNSYLAISQGWWEPLGEGRLYFILSNQDYIHCSREYVLPDNSWSMITVTWHKGICKLFVNGDKIAEHKGSLENDYAVDGPLYYGSDQGSTERKGRKADAQLAALTIWQVALKEREVASLFRLFNPQEDEKRRHTSQSCSSCFRSSGGQLLESRVLFDEDILWATSKQSTDLILKKIKSAGFNVYVPCVWHGRGTYYPSDITSPDSRVAERIKAGDDPLDYLLSQAHGMGIEVHPWFTVVRREDDQYRSFYNNGTPDKAYDVHNRQFREFISQLIVDVVRRYSVDGINLDYIRSMGVCSSPTCSNDYREKYGRSLSFDIKLLKIPGKRVKTLEAWNRDSVSAIVERVSHDAKNIRPSLIISVDAHPLHRRLALEGQDALGWVKSGLVDVIFNMDYSRQVDYEKAQEVTKSLGQRGQMIMLYSLYDIIDGEIIGREPEKIVDSVVRSRTMWPSAGVAYYHYKRLTPHQSHELSGGVFAEEAVPFWKNRPAEYEQVVNLSHE